jgi:hypothetical protein
MTLLLSGRRQVPSDVSVRSQRRINTVATGQVNGRRMIGYLEEKSWVMGVKAVVPDRARARAVL